MPFARQVFPGTKYLYRLTATKGFPIQHRETLNAHHSKELPKYSYIFTLRQRYRDSYSNIMGIGKPCMGTT